MCVIWLIYAKYLGSKKLTTSEACASYASILHGSDQDRLLTVKNVWRERELQRVLWGAFLADATASTGTSSLSRSAVLSGLVASGCGDASTVNLFNSASNRYDSKSADIVTHLAQNSRTPEEFWIAVSNDSELQNNHPDAFRLLKCLADESLQIIRRN